MTDIRKVYSRFLQKMSDYKFSLSYASQEQIEDELFGYYTSASANFIQCKKNLETNYDDYMDIPEGEIMSVKSDLTNLEIEILSKLMLVEYFRPILVRNETVEQALSDADFKIYSQANHLNQLGIVHKAIRKEVNADLIKYSFVRADVYED